MDVLPLNFRTFTIFGMWYENPERLWPLKLFYRSIVLLLILQFTLFQMIALFLIRDNVEEFSECLFLTMTYVAEGFKLSTFILQRNNIQDLLNKFRSKICQPRNPTENDILLKYKKLINQVFIFRMILTLSCALGFFVTPFLHSEDEVIELPFKTYQILNVSNSFNFAIAYLLQVIPVICGISTDVCLDSTTCAFIILTCGQLDLCCHRIISNKQDGSEFTLKEFVNHHVLIYLIAHKLQTSFIYIVLPVFGCGLVTLCTSIYQLSQQSNTFLEYVNFCLYLSCLLMQTFFYCWFGNELRIKSQSVANAVYESDWTTMKPIDRRDYFFIIFKSQHEFVISFHGQCTLSLATFIWMIKTSYGAFNLLQQVSHTS